MDGWFGPSRWNIWGCLQVRSSEDINSTIRQFFCSNRTYNDMATLFFNPQEAAIHQLFHQDGEPSSLSLFSVGVMATAVCCPRQAPSVP